MPFRPMSHVRVLAQTVTCQKAIHLGRTREVSVTMVDGMVVLCIDPPDGPIDPDAVMCVECWNKLVTWIESLKRDVQ